jgi:hypothetical protein
MPNVTHAPRLQDVQRIQEVEARRKQSQPATGPATAPKVAAQRKAIEASFGGAAQLAAEEEEPLQGKAIQRAEEEELLQGKAIQRVEEEEPLQGKAIQMVEEEEPLQGKAIQRVEEEEPLQGKAIQRSGPEEELPAQGKAIQRAGMEEEEPLQGKGLAAAQRKEAPNRTGMPDQLKSGIEQLSGMSLNDVKVNYNSSKPSQLNAHAYAQGSDIHVAPGQEKHLPHEAWHTVQQKQGRVKPTMQMAGAAVNDDASLETEADVMGEKALQAASKAKTGDD